MKKALIIENDALISLDLKFLLAQRGIQVIGIAKNSEEALSIAMMENPEIVFSEIIIKGELDGITVATLLKDKYNSTIVFVSTGCCSISKQIEKTKDFVCIKKPFTNKSLDRAIVTFSN